MSISASWPSPSSCDAGTNRRERVPAVLARLRSIRSSHVRREERPWNRWIPRRAASQVS